MKIYIIRKILVIRSIKVFILRAGLYLCLEEESVFFQMDSSVIMLRMENFSVEFYKTLLILELGNASGLSWNSKRLSLKYL